MKKTASDYLRLFHTAFSLVKDDLKSPIEAALAISKTEIGVSLRDSELIFDLISFAQNGDSTYLVKLNQMMSEGRIDALTAVSIDKMIKKLVVKNKQETIAFGLVDRLLAV